MSTLKPLESKNSQKVVELVPSTGARRSGVGLKPVHDRDTLVSSEQSLIKPIVGFDAAIKRICDLLIGGFALVVLMPFLVLVSILIKLDSTGPALFYQMRRGRNRELIKVYKFRTMYQDFSTPVPTAKSFIQTKENDVRVTRIGAFMRKTSIDELPQLLNVIHGTMSLVGPRPHPAPLDEQYKLIIPGLSSRYAIKPGLTGWAQVNGLRGETKRVEDMAARVDHDCYYIKNWSLLLDVKIIAMTVINGWTHRNAY